MDTSQSYLDEVEADIALCEEFLARDAGTSSGPGSHSGDRQGSQGGLVPYNALAKSASSTASAPAAADGNQQPASAQSQWAEQKSIVRRRLTDERRKEILMRLVTERKGRRTPGSSSRDAEERHARVEELLRLRRVAGDNTAAAAGIHDDTEGSLSYLLHDESGAGLPDPYRSAGMDATPEVAAGGGGDERRWASLPGMPPPGHHGGPYEFDPALLYTPASDDDSFAIPSDVSQANDSHLDLISDPLVESIASQVRERARSSGALNLETEHQETTKVDCQPPEAKQEGRRPASAPRPPRAPGMNFHVEQRIQKSRHSRQAVAAKVEAELVSELTFKPKIKSRPSARDQPRSLEDRIERLSQPPTAKWERLAKEKAEMEAGTAAKCSFAPKVGRGPQIRLAKRAAGNVAERLLQTSQERAQKRDVLRAEAEKAQMRECSFRPKTNSKTRPPNSDEYRPIHQRIGDIQRAKNEKLIRARQEKEAGEGEGNFKPTINQRSAQLAGQRRQQQQQGPGGQRGSAPGSREQSPLRASRQEKEQESKEAEYTFRPKINPNSEKILQMAASEEALPQSFLDRQRRYHRQMLEKRQMRQAAAEDGDCTFRPAINCTEGVLGKSMMHAMNVGESGEDRVERLSYIDKQRKAVQELMDEEHYRECTFQPKINERSRRIARPKPLSELASNAAIQRAREDAERKVAEELKQAYTFHPKVRKATGVRASENVLSVAGTDPSELLQRIAEQRRAKEQQMQEMRMARQSAELAECTFTPEINTTEPSTSVQGGPVVVRGLGRHMELQDLAKRQREEQSMREAKTFITHPQGRAQPFTVPQPFNLATASNERALRAARIREAQAAAEMAECTFNPATNQAAKRQLIEAILADPYTMEELDALGLY